MESDRSRLTAIATEIARIARANGRDPQTVELLVASKTQPAERLIGLLEAGHRLFGENRVQEALAKWPALKSRYPDLELHMIGPLQSNKAEDAVKLFDVIETLDRISLARAIARAASKLGRTPRLFVEVNTGAEPQKAGVLPAQADAFIHTCRSEFHLEIEGLMCIPPADQQASPHFALLAQIAARNGLTRLSMGMSADFALAIQLGATCVRVGSAIFGARATERA